MVSGEAALRNDSVVGSSEVWGSGSGAGVDAIGEAVHAFGEANAFPGAEVSASFV